MNYCFRQATQLPRLFVLALSFFVLRSSLFIGEAEAQPGTWQTHVSYRLGQSVAVVGSKLYAATQNGLFFRDTITNEITTLSKAQGLSDAGISRLLYLPDQNRLLIAYRSGNLDFLTVSATGEPNSILNLNTIVSAPNLPASRGINHLNRIGSNVYLSTDFGLVVLDVTRNEIRDTYFSRRPDGSPLPILQTAATTDSLYALTEPARPAVGTQPLGVRRHLQDIRFLPGVNSADPANWLNVSVPGPAPETIVADQNRLLLSVNRVGVFTRQAGRWVQTQLVSNGFVRLFATGVGVVLATEQGLALPGQLLRPAPLLANPREVLVRGSRVWVADRQTGVLTGTGGVSEIIAPAGPVRDDFAQLFAGPQILIAVSNGPFDGTADGQNSGNTTLFSVPDQRWVGLSGPPVGFNSAAFVAGQLFLGSYGGGLWQQTGQTLSPVPLPATISPFISSLATDVSGNLWLTTAGPNAGRATLHLRRADGQFQSFPAVSQPNIAQVVPDDTGFLWMRLDGGGGLLVFDLQTNRTRFLSTFINEGNLLTNSIRSLVKDRNGAIWVGTDLGPTVFDFPAGAFDAVVQSQPPRINGRRLLAGEVVTSMTVDGGNRKWIATRSGLYRVSPDGSQLLDVFTADNSPLPGNTIRSLAIEPTGGRVFILTDKGIVSYGGPATEPAETLSKLTIFPNPVRPDFTGVVSINGLTDNATVKIMDAGGQLTFETRSQGGTATWNLRDYRGRDAQTGIYLIVVIAADGTEGVAGKLAVVR